MSLTGAQTRAGCRIKAGHSRTGAGRRNRVGCGRTGAGSCRIRTGSHRFRGNETKFFSLFKKPKSIV